MGRWFGGLLLAGLCAACRLRESSPQIEIVEIGVSRPELLAELDSWQVLARGLSAGSSGRPDAAAALLRAADALGDDAVSADAQSGLERLEAVGLDRWLSITPAPTASRTAPLLTTSGGRIAAAFDRSLRAWDARSGAALFSTTTDAPLRDLLLSPSGDLLAAADHTGQVSLWELPSGKLRHRFTVMNTTDARARVRFDDSGRLIAAAAWTQENLYARTGHVGVWETGSGHLVTRLASLDAGSLSTFSMSPDGSTLATAGLPPWNPALQSPPGRSVIRLWDAQTGELQETLRADARRHSLLRFAPDSRWLAVVVDGAATRLWDTRTGRKRPLLSNFGADIAALGWTPDGDKLAVLGRDGDVRLWQTPLGRRLHTLSGSGHTPAGLSIDDETLAVGFTDGALQLWELESGRAHVRWAPDPSGSGPVSLAAPWVVQTTRDGRLRLHESGPTRPTTSRQLPAGRSTLGGSGAWLVHARARGGLEIRKIRGDDPIRLTGHRYPVREVSTGDRHLATATRRAVRIFAAETGRLISTLETGLRDDDALFLSPTGVHVSLQRAEELELWSSRSSSLVASVPARSDIRPAFSPTGAVMAWSDGRSVRLTRTDDGQVAHILWGPDQQVQALSFSGDGRSLAVTTRDGTLHIWDPTRGELRHSLHGGGGSQLAWSEDRLAQAGADATLRLFDAESGELLWARPAGSVRELVFSGDALLGLVEDRQADTARLTRWSLHTGTELALEAAAYGPVHRLGVRPDGFIVLHDDGWLRRWTHTPPADTNLRVCREDLTTRTVTPFPERGSIWAPASRCGDRSEDDLVVSDSLEESGNLEETGIRRREAATVEPAREDTTR